MDVSLLAAAELGSFINGFKLLPVVVISFAWLRLMTWADKDADDARLPRETVNCIHIGLWILSLAVFLFIPFYAAALPAFLFLFGADIATYLIWRNKTVGLADLKTQMAQAFK
ncbi:MAG TPA: hypothetical protein VGB55_13450, partial [Tepidisphaeraceae bacterium]